MSLPTIRVMPWSEEVINAFEGPHAMELVGLCREMEASEPFLDSERGMDHVREVIRAKHNLCESN